VVVYVGFAEVFRLEVLVGDVRVPEGAMVVLVFVR
jgi:hypothetical protein